MAKDKENKIKYAVLGIIEDSPEHSVFFLSDFAEITSLETIRKILSQACETKLLSRIAHGIYVKPMMSRFGEVPIPLEKVAKAIAERDHSQIMPTGSTAANLLGLSTQVPMVVSYITTGSSRTINIGNRSLSFRHAAPNSFAYKGTSIPLVVQAFKELGEENIGEREESIVSKFLSDATDKDVHTSDILLAPMWIQKKLKKLITHS
ncbi:MAG: DUF6088 family protein [Candidatus Cryptobacteroides sp.]